MTHSETIICYSRIEKLILRSMIRLLGLFERALQECDSVTLKELGVKQEQLVSSRSTDLTFLS